MRTYSEAEKAAAVGLAMTVGDKVAAQQLGVPRRTVTYWRAHAPGVVRIEPATTEQVASELWQGITEGLAAVRAGLADPRARLGDKAKALAVLLESHRLITGQATAHTIVATVTPEASALSSFGDEERRSLRQWLDAVDAATDDELREAAPQIVAAMRAANPIETGGHIGVSELVRDAAD